ncbi:MAG: 4-alpha-glucanotransferase [Clostridia bacterium]|nr:4-alpha-glucanotransferase [Clostridia bacterium]
MRASGVLMHISSLPSRYGIGTMGREAYRFVDFLKQAGQTYWQVLPLCPTSYGDSPYQSFSAFAGNPYFIDLELLQEAGLLQAEEYTTLFWGTDSDRVDYAALYQSRFRVLRSAFVRFCKEIPQEFYRFCEENAFWLEDYALFMTLKDSFGGRAWQMWSAPLRNRELVALEQAKQQYAQNILFYKVLQFWFYRQWEDLKSYANRRGIRIIGDISIYVAMDSADLWANPQQFVVDENGLCPEVAGCPPDAFCEDGQVWGNPLYNWEYMREDGYTFWCNRLRHSQAIYDVTRIDHFRGFDSYFCIPATDTTARGGVWRQGPSIHFFRTMEQQLGELHIIAEDLGHLTDSVRKLLKDTGFAGMKVLQFAFDSREESDYLPHNYNHHCVVYTGTHDNDTILGWMVNTEPEDVAFARRYLRLNEQEGANWGMMACALASVADTAILLMQDLLDLGSDARMNRPATLGQNWQWRMKYDAADSRLAEKLYSLTKLYGRLQK